MKAALIGPLPVIGLVIVGPILSARDGGQFEFIPPIWFFFGALFWTIIFGGFYVLLTGIVSGWIAHRFAFDTAVPASRLAIAIAWVANLSLWGWVVVVAMTDS